MHRFAAREEAMAADGEEGHRSASRRLAVAS